ncbi:hypothetical protein [Mycoplasma suis]|uniref:Uncharacterized protein n=1 Tax=Mycoplasma suis (strain Illinois) TaxID=768700 RepID=F0QS21_MYCSL|nr:hypothetical protein [Mycoplasma suis]ADX98291.1 hypothetical protein MSU_0766 [Mycoplasma suis str. Illinois]
MVSVQVPPHWFRYISITLSSSWIKCPLGLLGFVLKTLSILFEGIDGFLCWGVTFGVEDLGWEFALGEETVEALPLETWGEGFTFLTVGCLLWIPEETFLDCCVFCESWVSFLTSGFWVSPSWGLTSWLVKTLVGCCSLLSKDPRPEPMPPPRNLKKPIPLIL